MSDSIWKKEISFRRKPKVDEPEWDEPKKSIWKKEISLGRKKDEQDDQPPRVPEQMAEAPEAPPADPVPPVEEPAAAPPEPPAPREPLPHAAGDYEWLAEGAEPQEVGEPELAAVPTNIVHLARSAPEPAPEPASDPEPELAPVPEPERAKGDRRRAFRKRERPSAQPPEETPAAEPAARGGRRSRNAKTLIGLKVGASQIAAARVANNGAAELVQVARVHLPPGLVVGGELRDPDALADILRAFFREHRLPKRGVRLGISNNRIGVRTFEIVGIADPKQLANAIRFRAQEALPIPIDEAVLDYRVLAEGTNAEGEPVRRILLVVAYRDLVDRYVAACRKAGISLSGVDLEAFALLRSLSPPRHDATATDAAVVAVAIGHDRSTLAVSDGRVCEFTRVLEWGGAAITVAIARALDISPPEAEPVKRSLALDASPRIEGLSDEQAEAAQEAVRRQIQTFARELVSSLQFYQAQPDSLGIAEIVMTGGTAHLAGLPEELTRLAGVAVRVGDPLARVRVGKRVGEPEQVGSLAVAIGLGIED